jgi:hypothetical protein
VERTLAFGTGALHVTREAAVARTRFDDDERIGVVELVPAPIERPGDARAEERTDLGAGHEVAPGAAGAVPSREETGAGFVQRDFDEPVEGDRTLAPDEARNGVGRVSG